MDRKFNRQNIFNGINALIVVCGCILFYYIIFHWEEFVGVIKSILAVFTPFFIGITIAYLLNPIMKFTEKRVLFPLFAKYKPKTGFKNEKRSVRIFSVIITMIIFALMLYGLIMLIVPQITESIESIIVKIPGFVTDSTVYLNDKADELLRKNPDLEGILNTYWSNFTNWSIDTFVPALKDIVSKTSSSLVSSVIGVVKTTLNLVIGIIISVYLLFSKELFCAQAKKISYALLREERANNLINNMRYANKIFGGFISGKILDSFIIGVICYICSLILRLPYPALISVIVGVTNIIPVFGPFIGAIPSALFILLVSPQKCLTFLIFVLILQQFDGNILGPKILGDSTGLSSFWVIFAITLFSGAFGPLGLFLGVPVFAVIYAAIRTFVSQRLEKKKLPVNTDYYKESDYETDDTKSNKGNEFRFVRKTFENIVPEKSARKAKADITSVPNAKAEYDNIMKQNED